MDENNSSMVYTVCDILTRFHYPSRKWHALHLVSNLLNACCKSTEITNPKLSHLQTLPLFVLSLVWMAMIDQFAFLKFPFVVIYSTHVRQCPAEHAGVYLYSYGMFKHWGLKQECPSSIPGDVFILQEHTLTSLLLQKFVQLSQLQALEYCLKQDCISLDTTHILNNQYHMKEGYRCTN